MEFSFVPHRTLGGGSPPEMYHFDFDVPPQYFDGKLGTRTPYVHVHSIKQPEPKIVLTRNSHVEKKLRGVVVRAPLQPLEPRNPFLA